MPFHGGEDPQTREAAAHRVRIGETGELQEFAILEQIAEHVLLDGFRIVIDLEKSQGSYLYDAAHDHRLIDLYGFFGSNPVGFNHPHFDQQDVKAELLRAAESKTADSDGY